MTAPAPAPARPADYRIALPDGWFRIDVRPGRRKRAVQALLNRQFRGIGNAQHLRGQLGDQLMAMAQSAHASGGIEIYLCQQDILGVPIPASLVISLTPPPPDGRAVTPRQLAVTLEGDREVSLTGLPE